MRTKAVTSHLFTPLFMFIHLPLIHFAPPPRLLIDFKNRLTYFDILLWFVIVSLTWLAYFLSHDYFSYKFTRFFIYFLLRSDEGPMLETLDFTIRIGSTPTFSYFDLYLNTAYAAHYVHICICAPGAQFAFFGTQHSFLSNYSNFN